MQNTNTNSADKGDAKDELSATHCLMSHLSNWTQYYGYLYCQETNV